MIAMASQSTNASSVCSTVCYGEYQRKHQSSTWEVSTDDHKGPVTRKIFPFDEWNLPLGVDSWLIYLACNNYKKNNFRRLFYCSGVQVACKFQFVDIASKIVCIVKVVTTWTQYINTGVWRESLKYWPCWLLGLALDMGMFQEIAKYLLGHHR